MYIYIAYKYTNVKNKEELKKSLLSLAELLHYNGHKTFMLGRDVQSWGKVNHSLYRKVRIIFSQIKKANAVLAFVNSKAFSKGLLFEMTLATILGKRVIKINQKDLEDSESILNRLKNI